jgi:hypothetical protein
LKKSLLVLTLVVLGCSFALAQAPGSYAFWSAAGTEEYCNYNVIVGNSGGVVNGYDNTTALCGYEFNSPIVGFSATTPSDGLPVHGKGAVVGDGIYDDGADGYTGDQWTVFQSSKVSKMKKGFFTGAWCWIGVAGAYTGTYFGDNYGYCTAGAPVKGPAIAGHTTSGSGHGLLRK